MSFMDFGTDKSMGHYTFKFTVNAAKIISTDGRGYVTLENGKTHPVGAAFMHQHKPEAGGYLVFYPHCESYLPGPLFEKTHALVNDENPWKPPVEPVTWSNMNGDKEPITQKVVDTLFADNNRLAMKYTHLRQQLGGLLDQNDSPDQPPR